MYINNIEQLIRNNISLKSNVKIGSIIYGKPLFDNELGSALKLMDGTMLPAIFIEDNIEYNTFSKFEIININSNTIVLKQLPNFKEDKDNSIDSIIKNLNIPQKEAKEIIFTLLKFNIPATNENIYEIYNNLKLIESINKYDSNTLYNLLKSLNCEYQLNKNSIEDILSFLKGIDINFLSFLKENNLNIDIDNIIKIKNFINTFKEFNDFINIIYNNCKSNDINKEKDNAFFKIFKSLYKNINCFSLSDCLNIAKDNVKIYNSINYPLSKILNNNLPVLKQLNNTYNIFFFNTFIENNIFKNSIIIKKQFKNSKVFDIENIKLFLSVDTPNIGTVESYIQKNNLNLYLKFKVSKDYIPFFLDNILFLKDKLIKLKYNYIDISVETLIDENNIISLSDFFGDFIFRELDVKV